jgi:hypothetical protein
LSSNKPQPEIALADSTEKEGCQPQSDEHDRRLLHVTDADRSQDPSSSAELIELASQQRSYTINGRAVCSANR